MYGGGDAYGDNPGYSGSGGDVPGPGGSGICSVMIDTTSHTMHKKMGGLPHNKLKEEKGDAIML